MILKANKELKQNDFINEKELQTYFENNMETILGYKFIETEFVVENFRIDSLAYDKESNSFRIIEYKNVKNHSLVDQGYTYLKLMLNRKADFILKYNEKTGETLFIKDIDWSQSRIVFVSPTFTPYQLNATDFKNIPVDLVKVTKYEEDIVEVDFIKKTSNVKVEDIQFESQVKEVSKEIKVYTEEDHLKNMPESIKKLYETLKIKILELDDIDVDVKKVYIAFKGSKNIVDVELYKKGIQVIINMKKGTIDDPNNILKCFVLDNNKIIGHHGNGDYYLEIHNEEDIEKIIPFVKQSLKVNRK